MVQEAFLLYQCVVGCCSAHTFGCYLAVMCAVVMCLHMLTDQQQLDTRVYRI